MRGGCVWGGCVWRLSVGRVCVGRVRGVGVLGGCVGSVCEEGACGCVQWLGLEQKLNVH